MTTVFRTRCIGFPPGGVFCKPLAQVGYPALAQFPKIAGARRGAIFVILWGKQGVRAQSLDPTALHAQSWNGGNLGDLGYRYRGGSSVDLIGYGSPDFLLPFPPRRG